MALLASLTSLLATAFVLTAFAVDIALFAFAKCEMGKPDGICASTYTASTQFPLPPVPSLRALCLVQHRLCDRDPLPSPPAFIMYARCARSLPRRPSSLGAVRRLPLRMRAPTSTTAAC